MPAEKTGDGEQDAELGRGSEPVAFTGEELRLVGDMEAIEKGCEFAGLADRDDGVGHAVEDEGGRKAGGGRGGEGLGHATGDLDDGANAIVYGGAGEGEEGAERDADEGDAIRVNGGVGDDVSEGVADGVKPLREVDAVEDGVGVGADGFGAVEVVGCEKGDAEALEVRCEAVQPEADVSAGAVQEKDGGDGTGAGRANAVEADGSSTALKRLHGWFRCFWSERWG